MSFEPLSDLSVQFRIPHSPFRIYRSPATSIRSNTGPSSTTPK